MNRSVYLLLILTLMLAAVPVHAAQPNQPVGLTELFVGYEEAYSFRYYPDWELNDIQGFDVPIPSTGLPNSGISIESDSLAILFAFYPDEPNTTAANFATEQAKEFAELGFMTDPVAFLLNDKPLAQVDVLTEVFDFTYLVLEMEPETYLVFTLSGTPDQLAKALPLAYEVLGSARLRDDLSPLDFLSLEFDGGETYNSTLHDVAFDYPVGWEVQEQDSYVLLIAPNGVSYGFSQLPYSQIPPEGMTVNDVAAVAKNVREQVPDVMISDIVTFDSLTRPAARVDIVEPSTPQQMTMFSVEFEKSSVGKISVIGHPSLVGRMDMASLTLLNSLRPAE